MTIYAITGTRRAAALYYHKQCGTRLALRLLKEIKKASNGLYIIESAATKKHSEYVANKVQFITAYQQGRLGQRLGEGHALTISIIRS